MFTVMLINFFCFSMLFLLCLAYVCYGRGYWAFKVVRSGLRGVYWNSLFEFDTVSVSILLMLVICFGYAYFYTSHYFGGGERGRQLKMIICLFVAVMASLVTTGDFLTTLIFWEYLGVVSFFLILFYMKYLSLRASVVTLVSSRFGDVCLFFVIAFRIYNGAER